MKNFYILNMYGQGVVTLPKAWRTKTASKKFIAKELGDKLILEPLTEDADFNMFLGNPSFDFLKDEPDLYD